MSGDVQCKMYFVYIFQTFERLLNVSVIKRKKPIQAREREGGSQRRQKTTQVGQSIAKDSQVTESQKGRGRRTKRRTSWICI